MYSRTCIQGENTQDQPAQPPGGRAATSRQQAGNRQGKRRTHANKHLQERCQRRKGCPSQRQDNPSDLMLAELQISARLKHPFLSPGRRKEEGKIYCRLCSPSLSEFPCSSPRHSQHAGTKYTRSSLLVPFAPQASLNFCVHRHGVRDMRITSAKRAQALPFAIPKPL